MYSIVDLLPPAGGNSSTALALNDQGLVVGSASIAGMNSQPAMWQVGAGATAPGTYLSLFGGDNHGNATDVNNSGMIAGYAVGSPNRAVVWTGGPSYVTHELGNPAGFDSSTAQGLSEPEPGQVTWVVGTSQNSGGSEHATVWRVDAAGAILSTIDLEPTLVTARAKDVRVIDPSIIAGDEYVLVTGEVQLPSIQTAVVWRLDLFGNVLNRTDLGTLGGTHSYGYGINSLGHVAGSALPSAGSYRGFIHKNGAMINLGTLTNGYSQAFALNDADVVVGRCAIFSKQGVYQGDKAFVWQNGTMLDLRSQLGSAAKANWPALFAAYDVNTAGQIVGNGRVGKGGAAQGHGFLMTPLAALHADVPGTGVGAAYLSKDQVQPILAQALSHWEAAGADMSLLKGIDIRIIDLGGTTLGLASGHTIWLDDNAAGWSWFVDATPADDSEYLTPGDHGEREHMDLLTAIAHEVGHLLGYDHSDGGVMAEALETGIRMVPAIENGFAAPTVVDSILTVEWTGRQHRERDEGLESMLTLIGRFDRIRIAHGSMLQR